jgi:hypothetical protein
MRNEGQNLSGSGPQFHPTAGPSDQDVLLAAASGVALAGVIAAMQVAWSRMLHHARLDGRLEVEVLESRERADRPRSVVIYRRWLAVPASFPSKSATRAHKRDDEERREDNQPLPHLRFPLPPWLMAADHRSRWTARRYLRPPVQSMGMLENNDHPLGSPQPPPTRPPKRKGDRWRDGHPKGGAEE